MCLECVWGMEVWFHPFLTSMLDSGEWPTFSPRPLYLKYVFNGVSLMGYGCAGINPFRSCVGPRPTLWFSCSTPMSEDVQHVFVAPAPMSEPVRRFSSCSMDFGQHIAQVVLFLFLGRPCVLMWTGDCALYSHGCACRKMAGINK
jgi:hypothetical protein